MTWTTSGASSTTARLDATKSSPVDHPCPRARWSVTTASAAKSAATAVQSRAPYAAPEVAVPAQRVRLVGALARGVPLVERREHPGEVARLEELRADGESGVVDLVEREVDRCVPPRPRRSSSATPPATRRGRRAPRSRYPRNPRPSRPGDGRRTRADPSPSAQPRPSGDRRTRGRRCRIVGIAPGSSRSNVTNRSAWRVARFSGARRSAGAVVAAVTSVVHSSKRARASSHCSIRKMCSSARSRPGRRGRPMRDPTRSGRPREWCRAGRSAESIQSPATNDRVRQLTRSGVCSSHARM